MIEKALRDFADPVSLHETLDVWFRAASAKFSITWLREQLQLRTSVRGSPVAWLRGT